MIALEQAYTLELFQIILFNNISWIISFVIDRVSGGTIGATLKPLQLDQVSQSYKIKQIIELPRFVISILLIMLVGL